jgi:hypothetical protein
MPGPQGQSRSFPCFLIERTNGVRRAGGIGECAPLIDRQLCRYEIEWRFLNRKTRHGRIMPPGSQEGRRNRRCRGVSAKPLLSICFAGRNGEFARVATEVSGEPMRCFASFIDIGNWLPSASLRLADPGLGCAGCQPGPGLHAKPEVKDVPRAPAGSRCLPRQPGSFRGGCHA